MVMHARKTQRMNDGYFEKHHTHPYQNSKYSSSKNYSSSGDRYERIRDSPNGNYRSDSPDSQSSRDRERVYQSKNSYLQKIREKEREPRDYKSSRDKYPDNARSPKDKRSRESEYRSNHDRNDDKVHLNSKSQSTTVRDRKPTHNNCNDKRDDRERVTRIGDWSEHISSSGKKYYYNCKTEVSQWEKPREWIDRERDRDRFRTRDRDRESDRNFSSSSSRGSTRHDKHSNSRNASINKDATRESGSGSRHWSSSSSREDNEVSNRDSRTSRKYSEDNIQSTQDMDISPGDSTPTSEVSYSHQTVPLQTNSDQNSLAPVLLANVLPRLVSHPLQLPSTPTIANRPEASPLASVQSTPVMVPPPSSVTTSNAPGPPVNLPTLTRSISQVTSISESHDGKSLQTLHNVHVMARQTSGESAHNLHSLSIDTNHNGTISEGPPTPTHSETPECTKVSSAPLGSPPTSGSLSSLQGVASSLQALRPQGPSITPSLANHYRDDLVNHVRGWPAEILEKQADKLAQEAHVMGSIQCAKVSAELKSARSIVRLTEIQATLQEQRILFLRHQIKTLEEMKSQNSFMSDDS